MQALGSVAKIGTLKDKERLPIRLSKKAVKLF